jgi:hypothetical protein
MTSCQRESHAFLLTNSCTAHVLLPTLILDCQPRVVPRFYPCGTGTASCKRVATVR